MSRHKPTLPLALAFAQPVSILQRPNLSQITQASARRRLKGFQAPNSGRFPLGNALPGRPFQAFRKTFTKMQLNGRDDGSKDIGDVQDGVDPAAVLSNPLATGASFNFLRPCVLVTGITGHLASSLTYNLLLAGYTVHGTIRSQSSHVLETLPFYKHPLLHVYHADLLDASSFQDAASGCTLAVHAACPVDPDVEDVEEDLITPSITGTRHVMDACLKAGVRRVVYVSCFLAVTTGGTSCPVSEEDWADEASPQFLPDGYAKVVAERTAMEYDGAMKGSGSRMRVVSVNPAIMWGTPFPKNEQERPTATSCSHVQSSDGNTSPESRPVPRIPYSKKLFTDIAGGKLPGVFDMWFPVVHVRDVVEAIRRLLALESACGRYICSPSQPLVHMKELVKVLGEVGLSPSRRNMCSAPMTSALRVMSHVFPGGCAGQHLRHSVGKKVPLVNDKIEKELGIKFTAVSDVVRETAQEIASSGWVTR